MLVALSAAFGGWWITTKHPSIAHKIETIIRKGGSLNTLELRFGASEIMDTHRSELLKDKKHEFLKASLDFYPYLLMNVKYTLSEHLTGEGVILWDLMDGEMVINARNWEKTHGFGDCLNAKASKQEFKILNILARKGGSVDRQTISKALRLENEILDAWVDSCRRKNLIVQNGNRYRLHLQHPKFNIIPETKLERELVTQTIKNPTCFAKRYSKGEIIKLARSAFGDDFSIRKTTLVYLPVHSIPIKNPDGSVHTTHWNAVNGKQLEQIPFIE
jgi:hypothetical protein